MSKPPAGTDPRAVASSVQGSTSAVDYPWLPDFVELNLQRTAGRSESVAARNVERAKQEAALKREWIRKAAALLPLTRPLTELVWLVQNGIRTRIARGECPLTGVPGKRFIEAEVAAFVAEKAGSQARTGPTIR